MIKSDELATPTSCLNKAADDEPIFVLRANDRVAAATVRDWAQRAKYAGLHLDKVDEAMDLAVSMEKWRERNGL